jgi:hypothetical protein
MNSEMTTIPGSTEIDIDKVMKEFEGKSWRERLKVFDLYLDDFASAFLTPRELRQLLRGMHVRDPLPDPDVVTYCAMLLRNFIGIVLRNLEALEGWDGRAAGAEHALLLLMSAHADHFRAGREWEGKHGAAPFGAD